MTAGVNLDLGVWGPGPCPGDTGDGQHASHVTPLSTEASEHRTHQASPAAVDRSPLDISGPHWTGL